MKVLALNGSPRRKGNSSLLLKEFLRGAAENNAEITEIIADQVDIKSCRGCLKCNLYKECAIKDDQWPRISRAILEADIIVIASPVYFHHLPGPLKTVIDRFRSFVNVQVTENDLIHTPWQTWTKRFVLLLSLGSPVPDDARPIIDLFRFIAEILGPQNSIEVITATCLQMNGQIKMNEYRLSEIYSRIGLPEKSANRDSQRNRELLQQAYNLGFSTGVSDEKNREDQ